MHRLGACLPSSGDHPQQATRHFAPASAPAYASLALLASVVSSVVISGRFSLDVQWASDVGVALIMLVGLSWLLRRLGFDRLAGLLEAVSLFCAAAILAPLCAVILAATDQPLSDGALRHADGLLFGFDREAVASWLEPGSWATRAWVWTYNSLAVQPLLLLALLFLSGRDRRAWTLLAAWCFALLLSLPIFALLPALGTPPHVLDFVDVLTSARDGSLRSLGVGALTGIITFPSFHAAAATMLGWGFLAFGRPAWPMVALNVAMFASALLVGGHYLVDLPAGAMVAAASIISARHMLPEPPSASTPKEPLT